MIWCNYLDSSELSKSKRANNGTVSILYKSMSVYVYCLREDYKYQSSITGREFENDWFKLSKDGIVVVKGTHYKGYA